MNKKIILLVSVLSRLGFKKEASELEASVSHSVGKLSFLEY